jgi:type II secretory pathway pseudopilin PulG
MGAIIAVIVVVIIAAVVIYLLYRRQQKQHEPEKLQAENRARDLRASAQGLKLSDVVNFEGRDFVVQGSIHYNQDGSTWEDHLLVDGTTKRWLSVEDDEGLQITLWEKLVDPDLQPGEKRILYGGSTYVLEEQGHASFTTEGETGTATSGRYEYADYEADEKRLSFERYGEDSGWELATGRVIPEAALDIYPSSEAPA